MGMGMGCLGNSTNVMLIIHYSINMYKVREQTQEHFNSTPTKSSDVAVTEL